MRVKGFLIGRNLRAFIALRPRQNPAGTGGSLGGAQVFPDHAAFHDKLHPFQPGDVREGIVGDGEEVGELARGEAAYLGGKA